MPAFLRRGKGGETGPTLLIIKHDFAAGKGGEPIPALFNRKGKESKSILLDAPDFECHDNEQLAQLL